MNIISPLVFLFMQVVLETEITNKPALRLYENLGFSRDKRLFRYYLNGVDALRLKLWLRWGNWITVGFIFSFCTSVACIPKTYLKHSDDLIVNNRAQEYRSYSICIGWLFIKGFCFERRENRWSSWMSLCLRETIYCVHMLYISCQQIVIFDETEAVVYSCPVMWPGGC